MKAIREGRNPTPGSPVSGKKDLDDELSTSSNEGINLSEEDMNGIYKFFYFILFFFI